MSVLMPRAWSASANDGGLAATFSLLNWNVEKAKDPSLVREFAELARLSDLIFLQEAVPLKKTQTVIEQSKVLFEAFVRGLQDGRSQKRSKPGLRRSRQAYLVASSLWPELPISYTVSSLATEPWLRTPKATSVTLYPLADSDVLVAHCQPPCRELQLREQVKAYQGTVR